MREYRKYNNEEIVKICKEFFNDIITIDKNVDNVSRCEYFNAFYNKCKEHGIQLLYFSNDENIVNTETFYNCITTTDELIAKINEIIEQNK